MGLFDKMKSEGLQETGDSLGGNFEAVPSGVYPAKIKVAYHGTSGSSKAESITVIADLAGNEYKETIWITKGTGENYYLSKDGKNTKIPLPGFVTVDELCLITTGESLSDMQTEDKVVSIYNYDQKKDVPTTVPVLTQLIGQELQLGILRQIVDKQKKNDAGVYENTGETRNENVINKVFHAETGRTVSEYRHEVESSEFLDAWKKRNDGKDRNRAKGVAAGNSGASGSGRPGGDAPAAKKLFG